jgi:hypothetical protein
MIPCTWKTDGSPPCGQLNFSDQLQEDGYTKIQVMSKDGSPLNLMATTSSSADGRTSFPDSYFFSTRVVDDKGGSVSVGVVTPNEFLPGYKIKGMFYNGNLTNGSAALQCSYGPYLKSGDWIVLECTHHISTTIQDDDDNNNNKNNKSKGSNFFSMTIYVNGKNVGRGFEIEITSHSDQRFYPCVSVQGKVELLVQVMEQKPDFSVGAQAFVLPLQGRWKIVDANKDSTGKETILPVRDEAGDLLSPQKDIVITISESGDVDLTVAVKVYNSLSMIVGYTANRANTVYNVAPPKGIISTLMMPPPPYMVVEKQLAYAMENYWQSFRLNTSEGGDDTSNELTITTVNDHVMAFCVRCDTASRPPLVKYYH